MQSALLLAFALPMISAAAAAAHASLLALSGYELRPLSTGQRRAAAGPVVMFYVCILPSLLWRFCFAFTQSFGQRTGKDIGWTWGSSYSLPPTHI